jgi:hypothetical protein
MDFIQEDREFARICQRTGEATYGLGNLPDVKISYSDIDNHCFKPGKGIIFKNEYIRKPLTPEKRFTVAHEVAEALGYAASDGKSIEKTGNEFRRNFAMASEKNWVNHLINSGISEGKAISGCNRILRGIKDDEALNENLHRNERTRILWPYISRVASQNVKSFVGSEDISLANVVENLNMESKYLRGLLFAAELSDEPDEKYLAERLGNNSRFQHYDASRTYVKKILCIPYVLKSLDAFERMSDDEFRTSVSRIRARDLEDSVPEMDPVEHFLSIRPMPPEHEEVILNEIASSIAGRLC